MANSGRWDGARRDTVDVNDAILEVVTLIHSEVVKNRITMQTQLADHLPRIRGDRVQLQQVMLNLIINAIQAMSGLAEGVRELHISAESTESDGVRVAVRDSGPGLTEESLQRLFEPFYTTKPSGMGMGLSICRSIIEDHGGRLWATGDASQGAVFQFTIPALV
jgi:signal transduction histidine kinase